MEVVDRYWSAIVWDCQHVLHFSAYEYFQWELIGTKTDGTPWWQRKRPMDELLEFFSTLMNIKGSMTNEAVLEDPRTIEWMGSRSDSEDGPHKVRIFGHTETISLLQMGIEVQTGKQLPRPKIPGLVLRTQRKITKTHSAVEAAQERAKLKQAKLRAKRERAVQKD